MKITKFSGNFTPLNEGVFFGIDTEEEIPTDIAVEIIDVAKGEVVATQLLRNTVSATINIAPYIARMEEYAPTKHHQTTIMQAPTASYKIRVEDIESKEVVLSVNRCKVGSAPTIVTSLPNSRRIAHNENDELLIVAGKGKRIYVEMVADTGETLHLEELSSSEAIRLIISTEDFGTNIRSFDVALYCEGEKFGSLHYTVAPTTKVATRLAWISDCGTIEQYTFPLSHTAKRSADKQIVATEGGVVATRCQAKQVISLSSRYEPRATIEAIAQITSATKVWVKQGEKWDLVEVVTPHLEYNLFGEPSHLSLDVCLWQKEVML